MRRPGPSRAVPGRLAAFLALACLAACSSNNAGFLARFNAPADVVPFMGYTKKNPGVLHDYLAIASARGGDLAFIDPADDRAVPSPGAVFALSVATVPRPYRLAAASLGDHASGGADLLVASSTGSLDLQVIGTWSPENQVVPAASVSLASLVAEGEILSVAAFTYQPAGSTAARARVLAGVSGGRLAVVDYTRDPTSGAVVPGTPVVKSIGVDAVAIAVDPTTMHAYLATGDALPTSGTTPVYGVAWVDASQDAAQPWTVASIDARGPTSALAVARVNERIIDPANTTAADTFDTVARLRIYAILDPAGCGVGRAINCGVAMLDENGLLPDPSGEAPYRAPLPVTGVASTIAVMHPPASGTGRLTSDAANPNMILMIVQPRNRNTTAVAAVTTSDGSVRLYDLGRFSTVDTGTALTTGVALYSAASYPPTSASDPTSADYGKPMFLGLWNDFPIPPSSGAAAVIVDPALIRFYIQTTPGYTPSDNFFLSWQGDFPGLLARRGVIGRALTGETFVAIQSNVGTVAQPSWTATVTVSDPELGVHGNDIVVLTPDDANLCPTNDPKNPTPEVRIAADTPFLPADPALFPAGAVKIAAGSCFEQRLAPGQIAGATVTFRAAGLMLSSATLGYLGRPTFDQPFVLTHRDESGLAGEELVIARKLRRLFYPAENPCTPRTSATDYGCFSLPLIWDPIAPGPWMAFRPGLYRIDQPGVRQDPNDPAVLALLPRGSQILAQTVTGPNITGYRPASQGYLPTGVASYDPTAAPLAGHENDAVRFYAAFRDDQVLDVIPSISGGYLRTIR